MGVLRKIGERWYVDIRHDGRRIRKVVGTKKDAENALTAIRADILRGEYKFAKSLKIRFDDFMKEYLAYSEVNKKPNSYKRDISSSKHLLRYFEDSLLSKINAGHIEGYKKLRLNEETKRKKRVSPGTINRELDSLRAIFTTAKRLKKFDGENPVRDVKSLPEQEFVMRILKRDEADRLINASQSFTRALIIIALNTAMRKDEILNLRWNDVDFIDGFIHIKESKSSKQRKVPMNPKARQAIKNIKRDGEFIFHNPKTGTRIRDFYRSWKKACNDAGIQDLRFHDLRHTSATWMVQGGADLVTVRDILGHASIKMTVKYAHSTPESKKRAVDILASEPEPKKPKEIVKNWSNDQIEEQANHLISRS